MSTLATNQTAGLQKPLDLFTRPAVADGGHAVMAPGGYEWWYFDAEDTKQNIQIVGILLDGFVFHAGYLRQYTRFMRRPTKVNPPTAADFPCAYLCIYKDGKLLSQFMCQYAAGSFRAAADRVDVRVGPNRFFKNEDGTITVELEGVPWILTARGPIHHKDRLLSAKLTLRPRISHEAVERVFLSRQMTGAAHHWVVADPMCAFSGKVELSGPGGYSLALAGSAYHDHNYGTAPIGDGLSRWIWGRAFFSGGEGLRDEVLAFHFARPKDDRLADEIHVLHGVAGDGVAEGGAGGGGGFGDGGSLTDLPAGRAWGEFDARSSWRLAYPSSLALGNTLELTQPRVIDSTPFYLRVSYAARANTPAGSRSGTALCEVAYPHRLRWPVLGRMVEMSILPVK